MPYKKVIIDTDIGDDIDDAFALAMISRYENVELIGVTTVFRNTADRTFKSFLSTEEISRSLLLLYESVYVKKKSHRINKILKETGLTLKTFHRCKA